MTSTHRLGDHTADHPDSVAIAACSGICASSPTAPTTAAPVSRRTTEREALRRSTTEMKMNPPAASSVPAYAANRAIPAATCQPVSSGASSNDAISSSDAASPSPTTNVNAPLTGWLSADTTLHATTYVPSPRSSGNPTVTISPSACASSLSTRSPSVSSTRTPPSSSDTSSEKRSVTTSGAGSTCVPSAGVDVTNCA